MAKRQQKRIGKAARNVSAGNFAPVTYATGQQKSGQIVGSFKSSISRIMHGPNVLSAPRPKAVNPSLVEVIRKAELDFSEGKGHTLTEEQLESLVNGRVATQA